MGWPKQPGDDAQAHRELAQRNLVLGQENRALRAQLAALRDQRDDLRGIVSLYHAQLAASRERERGLAAEVDDISSALQGARDSGQSISYYVLGAWGDRLRAALSPEKEADRE